MAGAMIWWSFQRNVGKGSSAVKVRWHLIQRGLFLILLQITWVNSSWGGFRTINLWHMGIIGSIGFSMIFLTLIVHLRWQWRLFIGLLILLIHPFLLKISYNPEIIWQEALMQTFIDAGKFNKYPVLPWFAASVLGSVMASGWLHSWKTDKQRIKWSLIIGFVALLIASLIRIGRGYGNIFTYSEIGSYSFFFDQKYPASLYFSLWWFGVVLVLVALFIYLSKLLPKMMLIFTIPGRVALFFYLMHIAIMGVFVKRLDFLYREGAVTESLIGVGIMMIVMIPLCLWFYRVKRGSKNYFIRMI